LSFLLLLTGVSNGSERELERIFAMAGPSSQLSKHITSAIGPTLYPISTLSPEYLAEDFSYWPRVGIYLTLSIAIFLLLLRLYVRAVVIKWFGVDDLLLMFAVVINLYFFPRHTHMWSLASSSFFLTCVDIDELHCSNNTVNSDDRIRCRKTHRCNFTKGSCHNVQTPYRRPTCVYDHTLAMPNLGSRVLCTYRTERNPVADKLDYFMGGC
jgi:hypothetical protein